MARHLFGYRPSEEVCDRAGNVRPGAEVTIWDAETAGTQITDLVAVGTATVNAGTITTDTFGRPTVQGPDLIVQMWAQSGSGNGRWLLEASDAYTNAAAAVTTHNGDAAAHPALDARIDVFEAAGVAYTPTWGSTGTAPALGNGAIVGRKWEAGKRVKVAIDLTIGSTTTVGTGFYTFTLPAGLTAVSVGIHRLGVAAFFDSSAGGWSGGWTQVTAGGTTVAVFFHFPPSSASTFGANQWSATHPVAPATGDVFRLDFEYEKA